MKNKGITLVALIITIIVLLILATVSISLVINNGVLDKAQHGVDKYSEEEELEQIKLAVASAMLKGNGFLETENLNSELQAKFEKEAEQIGNSKRWSFELNKNYRIYEDGKVEENLLPVEYQQVEYIESTGTQYIMTDIVPTNTMGGYMKLSSSDISNICVYFGSHDTGDSRYWIYNESNKLTYGWNQHHIKNNTAQAKKDEIIDVNLNYLNTRRVVLNENTVYNIDTSLNSNNKPITIFAGNSQGTIKYWSKIKLYEFKISDFTNIIYDFVPVYNKITNSKGLYDLVEGKFYTNQGTEDDFIAGPNV